jgi:hypothetical protein
VICLVSDVWAVSPLARNPPDWYESNNYKILDMPRNRTQAVVVAVEGLGHDQLRTVAARCWSSLAVEIESCRVCRTCFASLAAA